MTYRFAIRVYYEDTDMGGIVYHANFLKFIERARSEWVAGLGLDQNAMRDKGIVFAVRRVEADYLLPARYGDDLEVQTTTASVSGARLVMDQVVLRGGERLFEAQVTVACMNMAGQPVRLPAEVRKRLH
ncbi:thioesterase [Roseovarius sp. HI0049]|nr:thioesterase [Roseovarius sp. HI0049]